MKADLNHFRDYSKMKWKTNGIYHRACKLVRFHVTIKQLSKSNNVTCFDSNLINI